MDTLVSSTEDTDLERLFNQARAYELLSGEQEQDIDRRKWRAVRDLQLLLAESLAAKNYLALLAGACEQKLPPVNRFPSREQHYLLRRELAGYLPGGNHARQFVALGHSIRADEPSERIGDQLMELELPASLVVGIAEVLLQPDTSCNGNAVADALRAWERHWPDRRPQGLSAPDKALARALSRDIARYLAARDLLIMHNMRLVFSIAGRHRSKNRSFIDLVQEGVLGLLRAAEKFHFERGYRFSTYAFNWITQSIRRSVSDSAGVIRYPGHVQEQLGRLHRERNEQWARSGSAPSDTRLAQTLGLSTEKTHELRQLRNLGISLQTPKYAEEEGITLLDSLPGAAFPDPGETAEQVSLRRYLLNEIGSLEPAEQQVIIGRWGLHEGPPLSRSEIADQMAVSREWVRQLERSALDKLSQRDTIQMVYKDHRNPAC